MASYREYNLDHSKMISLFIGPQLLFRSLQSSLSDLIDRKLNPSRFSNHIHNDVFCLCIDKAGQCDDYFR